MHLHYLLQSQMQRYRPSTLCHPDVYDNIDDELEYMLARIVWR